MKYCSKCGAPVKENSRFCSKCGSEIAKNIENAQTNGKVDDGKTAEINLKKITEKLEENEAKNINNNLNSDVYIGKTNNPQSNRKNSNSKIISISILGCLVVVIILGLVFHKQISSIYYMKKCNDSINKNEKMEYAIKAVQSYDNDKTKELLKDTLIDMSNENIDLAEQKLNEISKFLTQVDIKNISTGIEEKKIDKLCSSSKYEDALAEFEKLDKLGVDFKSNKHYDDVMLNVISSVTGTSYRSNKGILIDDYSIYYDNLDKDVFDEIVEVKPQNTNSYRSKVKVNLYKFKDGKYKLSDSQTINDSYDSGLQGIYNYDNDVKGIFVKCTTYDKNLCGTYVYGVYDGRLLVKGKVFGNGFTEAQDINNDGIYEVLSSSVSYASAQSKETSKWYSIHEDGSTPTEIDASVNSTKVANTNTGDYILENSDKSYLTEDDLAGLSKEQLALARNEIFARHGYSFKEEPFKSYFSNKSWYVANPNYNGDDSVLNEYEIANYKTIQDWEKK